MHANGWLNVAGALLFLTTAITAGPVDDLRAAAAKMRDDLTAVQSAYDTVAARNAGQDDTVLRLNLKGPENKVLLRLALHCRGSRVVWGAAYSVSQKWIHRIDPGDLTVARQTAGIRISGPVGIHFVTGDDIGPDATPTLVVAKINVSAAGNEVTGSFEAERASELQFVKSGAIENAGVTPMQSVPPRPQALKMSEVNSATLYLLCQAWERHALTVAAHIRALECAGVGGKAMADVPSEHPPRFPIRPAILKSARVPGPRDGKAAAAPSPKADEAPQDLDDIGAGATDSAKEAAGKSDFDSVVAKTREGGRDLHARNQYLASQGVRAGEWHGASPAACPGART